ncbi:uncharacterized protein LY89DRAFT_713366 [Mollisia scopiformis]|uniref:Zn(2)-C6 fungal-type domain-containing protein n=1 Tax=Mollisia scopiformis TaxID=149040 RepID=A0A194XWN4_MOLSC|nr:uncharacterized protein LY89DRAFT_713366 [Mollisia scopiformis]KUJ24541.1 hypothetical protein LY89DRAFT_713366 [Mollisia scopiformis]
MERQPRRRRRPALACLDCKRRKIKCDRNNPCGHCISTRSQCTYAIWSKENESVVRHPPPQSSGSTTTPSVYASSPTAQYLGIGTNLTSTDSASLEHQSWSGILEAARQNDIQDNPGSNNTSSLEVTNDEPDLWSLLQRIQKLKSSSPSSSIHELSENGRDILARQAGLHDSQIVLNKTRMMGWSHWMGIAQEFTPIITCFTKACSKEKHSSHQGTETESLIFEMGDLLHRCKTVARVLKIGRPSRHLTGPDLGVAMPSREVADTMAALYFESFESTHRILHVPTFWTEYRRYWSHPETVTTGLRLKILLVIGIGSSLCEHGDSGHEFRNMVHQWIYAAQTWLSGPLEKDRLNITGIQIHCLTILARQIFSIGGDLVWMSMGSLVHRAMQMGLHRDPKNLPAISLLRAEVRRRLWATILEMIVQSSLDSAMPPRISFDEFDTEAPSNLNDNEIHESIIALQSHPKESYTTTSIQIMLLEALPTRLQVLQLLNGLHSELSFLDVLKLSSEITEICQSCTSFMKKHSHSGVTAFHRNLTDYLLRRFLIPLHCPFASKARTNPLFHYSLKISLDTAMAIISPEPDERFSRIMAIGGGLFREGFRYACSVLSLELIAQAEAQQLDGTLHRNSHYRHILKQAVKNMISFSSERIQQAETNIKAHMFLSMVLAQVEAMEAGKSYEIEIAQSGRDSVKYCLEMLQARTAAASLRSPSDADFRPTILDVEQDIYGLDLDFEFFLPDAGFS